MDWPVPADTTFAVGAGFNSIVYSIAPATDDSGDVYVGGSFTVYDTTVVDRMVRLSPTGVSK